MPGTSPAQDQDFLKASPRDQHAYLQSVDPDYAKASPDDQRAYIDHVTGAKGGARGAAAVPPVAPPGASAIQPMDPSPYHEGVVNAKSAYDKAVHSTPLEPYLNKLAPIGKVINNPNVQKAMAGLGGGIETGGEAAISSMLHPPPTTSPINTSMPESTHPNRLTGIARDMAKKYVGPTLADTVFPQPVETPRPTAAQVKQATTNDIMRGGISSRDVANTTQHPNPAGSSESIGRPIESSAAPGQPRAGLVIKGPSNTSVNAGEGVKGSISKPSGRLVLTPEEARSQARMQSIAKIRASEHGMQYAAGMRPAGGGRVPMTPTGTVTPEYGGPKPTPPEGNLSGIGGTPAASSEHEELSNAIQASGKDGVFADKRAQQLLDARDGKPGYMGAERRAAQKHIDNYMGPERRGK